MTKSYILASDLLLQRRAAIDVLNNPDGAKGTLQMVLDPKAIGIVSGAFGRLSEDAQVELHLKGMKIYQAGKVQPDALKAFADHAEGLLRAKGKDQLRFSDPDADGDDGDDDGGDGRPDGGGVTTYVGPATIVVGIIVVVVIIAAIYVLWNLWHDPNAFKVSPNQPGWGGWFKHYIDNPHRIQPDFADWVRDVTGSNTIADALEAAVNERAIREAYEEAMAHTATWGDTTIHGPNDPNGPIWVDTSSPGSAPSSAPGGDEGPDKEPTDEAPPMA